MIVDCPVAVERVWIPKGKRLPRGFVYDETVPVEIAERSPDEMPRAALVRNRDNRNQERHYWVEGGRWFAASSESLIERSVDEARTHPSCLGLAVSLEGVGGRRTFSYHRGISRDGRLLVDGSLEEIAGLQALPEGRDGSPVGFDPMNGRREECVEAARALRIVDGAIVALAREPVIRVRVSHYFHGKDSIWIEAGEFDPVDEGGVFFRLDDIEAAREHARGLSNNDELAVYDRYDVDLHRPDLLFFDPLPDALRVLAKRLLEKSLEDIGERSVGFFTAFAALRDVAGVERVERAGTTIGQDVDAAALYEAVVELAKAGLSEPAEYLGSWHRWPIHQFAEEVVVALRSTSRRDEVEAALGGRSGPELDVVNVDPRDMLALSRP